MKYLKIATKLYVLTIELSLIHHEAFKVIWVIVARLSLQQMSVMFLKDTDVYLMTLFKVV